MAEKISTEDLHLDGPGGRRPQAGRASGPGLDDVPGQAADGARRRAGTGRARPRRAPTRFPRRRGRRDRQRRPGPATGAAGEPFSHVSRGLAAACDRRSASVSERTSISAWSPCTPIDGWSPDQSEWFRSERQQPLRPADAVPPGPGCLVDLGCGTGDLTRSCTWDGGPADGRDRSSRPCGPGPVGLRRCGRALVQAGRHRDWLDEGLDLVLPTHHSSRSMTISTSWRGCAPPSVPMGSWPSRCRPTPGTLHTCWRRRWPTSLRSSMRSTGTFRQTRRFELWPELYADLLYELGEGSSRAHGGLRPRSSRRARSSNGSWAPSLRLIPRGWS